jgi:MFS family permease
MTDPHSAPPARGHRAWIVPLVLAPVIFLGCSFIFGTLSDLDDTIPQWVGAVVLVGAVVGPAIALVVSIVAAVRLFSSARQRTSNEDPKRVRAPSKLALRLHAELARQDAAQRGLTSEEYGVYKGDVGSAVKPVNSASGLLTISIILTVISLFVLVLIGVLIAQSAGLIERNPDDRVLGPVEWFFVAVSFLAPFASWHYYRVERRAQKLRISRGLPRNIA